MSRAKLEIVDLFKQYDGGDVPAVDHIDLSIRSGETVALLGPSGCGKSTTLNMIVGLEEPTSGDILIDGKSIVGVAPGKRNVGLVFQDYAVFTSMSVRKNLAFGLKVRGVDKAAINKAVDEVAELLDMKDKLNARAKDLGGSELQRVAIGRTLVTKPAILLLDEPLSNLEAAARLTMRRELRRLQNEIGITVIYVTHDQVEALSLADRIAVMRAGKVLQAADTARIYDKPDHVFVASFLGSPPMNLLKGACVKHETGTVFTKGDLHLPVADALKEGHYTLGVRPESLRVGSQDASELKGDVILVEPRGPEVVLTVEINNQPLKIVAPSTDYPAEGERIGVVVDRDSLVFFGGDTNRRVDLCPA